jgi:hypothetical protein
MLPALPSANVTRKTVGQHHKRLAATSLWMHPDYSTAGMTFSRGSVRLDTERFVTKYADASKRCFLK